MINPDTPQFAIAMITAPSEEVARKIAAELLKLRLAACVNLVPGVNSLYTWEGEVHEDEEILMLVKCRLGSFEDRFVPAVQRLHPYDVPEIIALPLLKGAQNYLQWMWEVTGGEAE